MTEVQYKKQFIAGAVCPACEKMDTIRMWLVEGTPYRECVVCQFADTLNQHGHSVPLELPTRVNTVEKPVVKQSQTLQFFPNPKLRQQPETQ